LVEARFIGKARVVFVATQRGINVVKFFSELNKTFPIIESSKNGAVF
jgi:hypothetical protein